MCSYDDIITDLKLKIQTVNRRNLRNSKAENSLRNLERTLTEQISVIKFENELMLQQMQDLKNQISETNYQMKIIDMCNVSEKSKFDNHIVNINAHKQGYNDMFAREQELSKLHNEELKGKVAQEEEIERQKLAKSFEINEQKGKEAAAIEDECGALERECSVLKKRNKAIMLKLRRKLVESEDKRLELMKKNGLVPPSCDNSEQT